MAKYSGLTRDNPTADQITDAVRTTQKYMGLEQTGILDAVTIDRMSDPRCSVSDVPSGGRGSSRKKRWTAPYGRITGWTPGTRIDYKYTHDPSLSRVHMTEKQVLNEMGKAAQVSIKFNYHCQFTI